MFIFFVCVYQGYPGIPASKPLASEGEPLDLGEFELRKENITQIIIHMKIFIDSIWLRAEQVKCNTSAISELRPVERQEEIFVGQ